MGPGGSVIRTKFITPLLLATAAWPSLARADSDGLATLGLGANFGLAHHNTTASLPMQTFAGDLRLKARLLKAFGFEVSYGPWDQVIDGGEVVLNSQMKLSFALHMVPTSPVGFYLKGGIGAADPTTLFNVGSAQNSYHGGVGFDIHTQGNLEIDVEFLMLIRGHEAWLPTNLGELVGFGMDKVLAGSAYRFTVSVWYFL
jgi:hypothetical protein